MTRRTLNLILVATFMLIAALAGRAVWQFERTLREGDVVLLQLAPVDPRSLMQGDYMALRFALDDAITTPGNWHGVPRYVYVSRDPEQRGSFFSSGNAATPPPDTLMLRVRRHDGRASVGPNAFFFQEGTATAHEAARWGEFRVMRDGTSLLTHLRDENLVRIGSNATGMLP